MVISFSLAASSLLGSKFYCHWNYTEFWRISTLSMKFLELKPTIQVKNLKRQMNVPSAPLNHPAKSYDSPPQYVQGICLQKIKSLKWRFCFETQFILQNVQIVKF